MKRSMPLPGAALGLTVLVLAIGAASAAAGPAVLTRLERCAQRPSTFCLELLRRGWLPDSGGRIVLAQRAIEDEPRRPKRDEDEEAGTEGGEGDELPPVPPAELGAGELQVEPPSPVKAMLLSAALPGLGQLYADSNSGYLFMGVEAGAWLTWGSYRSSSSNKEGDMFAYADDHFAIDVFERNCVSQDGQSCVDALQQIEDFYAHDRAEYYEIISKNPIYKAGWGARQADNPPPFGTEEYRAWVASLGAAQDDDYIGYNQIRDERNDLSRTARGMTVVILLNHLVSAWHAYAAAGGLHTQVSDDVDMHVKVSSSWRHPGARVVFSRAW